MTHLTVRRLLIDLEAPFDRHWCGNDAFRTALFNALSMSFPVGEQFFMDAVRNGYQALPPEASTLTSACACSSALPVALTATSPVVAVTAALVVLPETFSRSW